MTFTQLLRKSIYVSSLCFSVYVQAQDTFSIVAVDPVTGEVGSAGASCVDLFQTGLTNDDFLGQLVPNVGAINTQAYYLPLNQSNALARMNAGDTPEEIIQWLVANDAQNQPEVRQYGIAALINGSPETAGHTGTSTDDYKNHILGTNYAIQGNILLGQEVLDSMESRFLNEPGDLACKLMAALQGANMVGADTRCSSNGTSSLFAFVKVAQPSDTFGSPSFKASVRTQNNAGIEPIDSLQTKFNVIHSCTPLNVEETEGFNALFSVYPVPATEQLTINNNTEDIHRVHIIDQTGRYIYTTSLNKTTVISTSGFTSGIYVLKLQNAEQTFVKKIVIK